MFLFIPSKCPMFHFENLSLVFTMLLNACHSLFDVRPCTDVFRLCVRGLRKQGWKKWKGYADTVRNKTRLISGQDASATADFSRGKQHQRTLNRNHNDGNSQKKLQTDSDSDEEEQQEDQEEHDEEENLLKVSFPSGSRASTMTLLELQGGQILSLLKLSYYRCYN